MQEAPIFVLVGTTTKFSIFCLHKTVHFEKQVSSSGETVYICISMYISHVPVFCYDRTRSLTGYR